MKFLIAQDLFNSLNVIKTTKLTVEDLKKLIKNKKALKKFIDDQEDLIKEIMTKFSVNPEPTGTGYNYSKHPQIQEINNDLKAVHEEKELILDKIFTWDSLKTALEGNDRLALVELISDYMLKD